eukprot:2996492-Alexandrium_andersonii.AAC.1
MSSQHKDCLATRGCALACGCRASPGQASCDPGCPCVASAAAVGARASASHAVAVQSRRRPACCRKRRRSPSRLPTPM